MRKITFTFLGLMLILNANMVCGQECGPNLTEIYSFPIGSEFQYKTTTGGEMPEKTVLIERFTITDKWDNGNSLFYTRLGHSEYKRYNLYSEEYITEQSNSVINDTVEIINTPQHYLNFCEDQLVRIDSREDYFSFVKVEEKGKTIGGEDNLYEYDESNNLVMVDNSTHNYFRFEHVFEKGIGLIKKSFSNSMYYKTIICEGFKVGSKSFGSLTSVNEIRLDDALKIYPNVVQDNQRINIESDYDYKSLSISSLDGRVIATEALHQEYISLDDLPRGVYFLTFIFDNHRITRKVFKL